ncbi:hypothetical protein SeLEV6574_g03604 [Synchytrium endobioticum]|uniref:Uncharacterized protein n=1 Tax=Synchytrium endobioticum TaxID=286115 RepID=A0A507D2Z6_9FUNG|nr:hypothetical protein SeLEV6574_g03604 [Synchytrium endobioticum]
MGKVVDELDKAAASMKQAADDGRKRMPKSFYEKLDRLTRRSFLVNDDVKTGLAAALGGRVVLTTGRISLGLLVSNLPRITEYKLDNILTRMTVDGIIGARVGSEHLLILEKVEALRGDQFLENLSWPDTSIKIPTLTRLIQKVAADIDTVFSNQIIGVLPLLKERIVEVVGEEGKQAIEEIEA